MPRFENVLVTGASRGLGAAIGRALLARGHRVVLTARNAAELARSVEALRAQHGDRVQCWAADLADVATAQTLVAQVEQRFGALDALVNNAGIGAWKPLVEWPPAEVIACINLNLLKTFYAAQSRLHLQLQRSETAAAPFDIIVLHVCSLSWDDLAVVGMRQHPLLQRFDVVFSNFNSAASYSGPASLRLLHGTCGQQAHTQIYDSEEPSCYVFPSLEKLGYQTQALLNHDGVYEGFGATLEEKGGLAGKFLPNQNAAVHMQNFDGSPIYNDYALLSQR